MVPTTRSRNLSQFDVAGFYDALASNYDAMTDFEMRFAKERPFFAMLVERYKIKSALDAGCGSGFHSMLLAQLGVQVTGVDVSTEMLLRLQKHAKELDLRVRVVNASFQGLKGRVKGKFGAVFSMGNSLAHLLTRKELAEALRNFACVLRPTGILLVQNLNYDRILASRENVQSSKGSGGKTFVRFYEFDEEGILFNILTLDRLRGKEQQKRQTVRLRPLLRDDLVKLLKESGFSRVKTYGSIAMEKFTPAVSKDLVVLAQKQAGYQRR